ncbi:MAG: 2-C-methyl-D-erythritol 4-phosphate cytidylyltransferase [Cyclobacteriaceae bacterium]
MSQHSVIIVAGGSGSRMNQALPKQFTPLHGKPVLVYTIEAFLTFDLEVQIVLVLPKAHFETWKTIQNQFLPNVKLQMVIGGATRYQSVVKGLAHVRSGLVAIHDAVRPCISPEIIAASFDEASQFGAGVVAVPLKDSIREVDGDESKALDRSKYQVVQTPQTFQVEKIKKAFEAGEQPFFTDDASVYEHVLGAQVRLVTGDYRNIKITTPEDLEVAALFLANKKN